MSQEMTVKSSQMQGAEAGNLQPKALSRTHLLCSVHYYGLRCCCNKNPILSLRFHFRQQKNAISPLNTYEKVPETYKTFRAPGWEQLLNSTKFWPTTFNSLLQTVNPEFPELLTSFFPQWIVIFSASLLKIHTHADTQTNVNTGTESGLSTFILSLAFSSSGFIHFICCQIKWSAGQGVHSVWTLTCLTEND